jgi:hypothetical protein
MLHIFHCRPLAFIYSFQPPVLQPSSPAAIAISPAYLFSFQDSFDCRCAFSHFLSFHASFAADCHEAF